MINTREIAEEYRLTHWAQVMAERTQRGMTVKAFCEHIGICGNTYFYWQRRVREAAAKQLEQQAAGSQALVPSGWTQISATKEEPSAEGTVEKVLPIEIGGYRIMASESTDSALLEKVCRVLGALC